MDILHYSCLSNTFANNLDFTYANSANPAKKNAFVTAGYSLRVICIVTVYKADVAAPMVTTGMQQMTYIIFSRKISAIVPSPFISGLSIDQNLDILFT